jgi:hypothetical protein
MRELDRRAVFQQFIPPWWSRERILDDAEDAVIGKQPGPEFLKRFVENVRVQEEVEQHASMRTMLPVRNEKGVEQRPTALPLRVIPRPSEPRRAQVNGGHDQRDQHAAMCQEATWGIRSFDR